MTLAQEADRLCVIHQDHSGQIQSKNAEISSNWESLKSKAQERRRRLDESYLLHRFLADFRDLVSWIHDMKAIISADELAKDVAGAEALLERHQEHKVCIEYFQKSKFLMQSQFLNSADKCQRLLSMATMGASLPSPGRISVFRKCPRMVTQG
nr:spectrin alpha chain-like [Parasteatoda tepidariorum]